MQNHHGMSVGTHICTKTSKLEVPKSDYTWGTDS
jgi:hypothetical protein